MPIIHLSYSNSQTQFVQLKYVYNNANHNVTNLQLPAWRPGRYELANYAQYIRDFKTTTPNVGIQKTTKDNWQITAPQNTEIVIEYSFYAARLDAGNSYLDDEQLYINPINCIPFIKEFDDKYELKLCIPDDYIIACALPKDKNTLLASSYFQLADSPFIASNKLQELTFKEANCTFHIWFCGEILLKKEQIINDFQKYTQEQIKLFGEFPCPDYHYLIQTPEFRFYHGVEHANSTVIALGPAEEVCKERYIDLLGICSHELFHTWNICRIRPKELMPYDLTKENYFETGYIAEGITTYYGDYMLARSGVLNETQFFEEIATYLQRYFDNEAYNFSSLTDASHELWVDGYKEGTPHRKVSIYVKGALTTMIADYKIRSNTNNQRSLDDVLRLLWHNNGKTNVGYSTNDYKEYLEQISGISFSDYFKDFITGTTSLLPIINKMLNYYGCEMNVERNRNEIEGYFGLKTTPINSSFKITNMALNSPAEQNLMLSDIITAMTYDNNLLKLEIIRRGRPKRIEMVPSNTTYFDKYTVAQVPNRSNKQIENYTNWLNINI